MFYLKRRKFCDGGVKISLYYELKTMGINGLLAFACPLSMFILLLFMKHLNRLDISRFLFAVERVIPLGIAWWAVLLLQPVFELEGGNVYLTYPIKRWYLGSARLFRLAVLYSIISSPVFILLATLGLTAIINFYFVIITIGLLMSSFALLAMIITHNTIWSIAVIIVLIIISSKNSGIPGLLFSFPRMSGGAYILDWRIVLAYAEITILNITSIHLLKKQNL